MVTLQDIHDARAILGSRLHRTPVLTATTLGAMAGVELLVKAELLQLVLDPQLYAGHRAQRRRRQDWRAV